MILAALITLSSLSSHFITSEEHPSPSFSSLLYFCSNFDSNSFSCSIWETASLSLQPSSFKIKRLLQLEASMLSGSGVLSFCIELRFYWLNNDDYLSLFLNSSLFELTEACLVIELFPASLRPADPRPWISVLETGSVGVMKSAGFSSAFRIESTSPLSSGQYFNVLNSKIGLSFLSDMNLNGSRGEMTLFAFFAVWKIFFSSIVSTLSFFCF